MFAVKVFTAPKVYREWSKSHNNNYQRSLVAMVTISMAIWFSALLYNVKVI